MVRICVNSVHLPTGILVQQQPRSSYSCFLTLRLHTWNYPFPFLQEPVRIRAMVRTIANVHAGSIADIWRQQKLKLTEQVDQKTTQEPLISTPPPHASRDKGNPKKSDDGRNAPRARMACVPLQNLNSTCATRLNRKQDCVTPGWPGLLTMDPPSCPQNSMR